MQRNIPDLKKLFSLFLRILFSGFRILDSGFRGFWVAQRNTQRWPQFQFLVQVAGQILVPTTWIFLLISVTNPLLESYRYRMLLVDHAGSRVGISGFWSQK